MSMDEILEINVGGQVFTTLRSTLCFCPDSMLAKMFEPETQFGSPTKDQAGPPFLDRDGNAFHHILGYLRGGCSLTAISSLSSDQLEVLLREAEYFALYHLVESIKETQEQKKVNKPAIVEYRLRGHRVFLDDRMGQNRSYTAVNDTLEEMARDGWSVESKTMKEDPNDPTSTLVRFVFVRERKVS